MSKLVVFSHLTLDGVMQAPGRPDEDTRGGFTHGGWAAIGGETAGAASAGFGTTGGIVFGRRTYEDFFAVWPNAANNPFTEVLNATPKYVVSRTLHEPLPWHNSTLLTGDAADAVAKLKQQASKDLLILGSGKLIRSLLPHRLIDEYILMIHPLVLGTGQPLFAAGVASASLALVNALPLPSGVIMATYRAIEPALENGTRV